MSDPNVIGAAPWVAFAKPYIDATVQIVVATVVSGVLAVVAAKLKQWFGVQIEQSSLDQIKSAAATQAGVIVAAAEDNLAGKSITVDHPAVISAANWIAASLPNAAKAVGASPESLQTIVAGEIGKLQAVQPASVPK